MNLLQNEYLFLEIIQYLDYKDLSEISFLNRKSKNIYKRYYSFLWHKLIDNKKDIKLLKHENQNTLRHNFYGLSYSNKLDVKKIFNLFVNSQKKNNIEI